MRDSHGLKSIPVSVSRKPGDAPSQFRYSSRSFRIGIFSRPSTIRPPIAAALSISAAPAENVHASQVEMPRGLQHVAVVCIDLSKAVLLGAGEVQRVT
jgi:hypothetical protein